MLTLLSTTISTFLVSRSLASSLDVVFTFFTQKRGNSKKGLEMLLSLSLSQTTKNQNNAQGAVFLTDEDDSVKF